MRGSDDRRGDVGLVAPREDVENGIGASEPFVERRAARRLDRVQAVLMRGNEQRDHLTIAVRGSRKPHPHLRHRRRQSHCLEWRAVPDRPGFAFQDRNIVPWIVDGPVATEGTIMLADNLAIL